MAKHKAAHIREVAIFIVLVVITGFIFVATGNFDNPLTEISDTITFGNLIQEQPAPTSGDLASDTTPITVEGTDVDTAVPDKGIDWSQFGSVLFNIWFLCAVTAVVIVLQQVLVFIKRRLILTRAS
jgi:hypothetical protein